RLLAARPDLAVPAPQDSAQLASRAGTKASLTRVVDQLTHLELVVLDAVLVSAGSVSADRLHDSVNAEPDTVERAVEHLRDLALLWGTEEGLRVPSAVGDILGTSVSGLGPGAATLLGGYGPTRVAALARDLGLPVSGDRHTDLTAIAAHLDDRATVDALLAEVDDRARAILGHLEREGKDGSVESTDRVVVRGEDVGPVDQLLARGLLIARDRRHVAVPREVAITVRDGHTTRDRADAVPDLLTSERPASLVDRAASGAAFELVRHLELMLEHWGVDPPAALRAGGLGVRELRSTAELLHVEQRVAALMVELAVAAGLATMGSTEDHDAVWLPTDAFDVWMAASTADRWYRLAQTWLDTPRLVALVGSRSDGKPVNALAPDLERAWLPQTRRFALAELAALPQGQVLAAGTGVPALVARLNWLRPRLPRALPEAVAAAMEEAALVGVVGLGGLAAHGRGLLGEDPAHQAPAQLEPMLPEPVDHMLLQADLTAVAPGPLVQELAHQLASVADVESRGGATVYRFTNRSVRRAFDSGWSVAEVHAFLTAWSQTPVPQALTYLVNDVSRKFGTIRAGAAESFLRSDDDAALAELVHHPRAATLRLRRIAPTVVVSDVSLDVLLPRLRDLGASPVVEASDGTVRLARREVHRARTPVVRKAVSDPVGPGSHDARSATRAAARVAATVTAIRAGDRAAESRPAASVDGRTPRGTPAATMAVLREAADVGQPVWIGYVDNHGSTGERVVDPVKVEGGWLTAYDRRSDEVRGFAVHRITAAQPMRDPDDPANIPSEG
ncbi:MAG: helicase-associated domain-containing protein, partial [Nocardioides sp.]